MAAAIIFRYTVKELKDSQDNGQWETFECDWRYCQRAAKCRKTTRARGKESCTAD